MTRQPDDTLTVDLLMSKVRSKRPSSYLPLNLVVFVCSAKSTVAAQAAKGINRGLKVNALQNRVSPATEDVFNDKFWGSLDLVVNALDNVNARLYVDSRCVYFGKPLLESGTLGPKCNTQVVMPNLTENYGEAYHSRQYNSLGQRALAFCKEK